MAWNVIETHPLLGVGAGAYSYVFRQYLSPDLQDKWLFVVHNIYLLRWAETGFFGLISFLILPLVSLRQALVCIRLSDEIMSSLALGWSAGLVSILWQMWWDTTLGFPANSLIWFMFGLILVIKRVGFEGLPAGMGHQDRFSVQWSLLRPGQKFLPNLPHR
jgi:O-antigen ligase